MARVASGMRQCHNSRMKTASAAAEPILDLAKLREDVLSGKAAAIRRSSFVSQAELAESIGTVRSTVCSWEQRRRLPRGELARRYGRVLALLERRLGGEARP